MRYLRLSALLAIVAAASAMTACGSDKGSGGSGGDGGDSGWGSGGGSGGWTGNGGAGGASTTSTGSGGDGGNGGDEGVVTSCDDYSNTQPPVAQSEPLVMLHHFNSAYAHPGGTTPLDTLVEGPDGNLYGVASGGAGSGSNDGSQARGVVFRLSPEGTFTTLHTFEYGKQGAGPDGALIVGPDCALYGTTREGGKSNKSNSGTVFRITLAGELNYLADFANTAMSGPTGPLLLASDGNFYGTTASAVFRLTPDGTLSKLVQFDYVTIGASFGGLTEGSDGKLYGIAGRGANGNEGAIFRVSLSGDLEVLWDFTTWTGTGDDMGSTPTGRVVEGADGNFYGTTLIGGAHGGGTLFRITPAGAFTTVYSFKTLNEEVTCNCGVHDPLGPLRIGSDGALYGATGHGTDNPGAGTDGAVFRATLDGQLTPLAYMRSSIWPNHGGLIESSDGYLYGVGRTGGDHDDGVIYRVRME